jgi:hypothetical protein
VPCSELTVLVFCAAGLESPVGVTAEAFLCGKRRMLRIIRRFGTHYSCRLQALLFRNHTQCRQNVASWFDGAGWWRGPLSNGRIARDSRKRRWKVFRGTRGEMTKELLVVMVIGSDWSAIFWGRWSRELPSGPLGFQIKFLFAFVVYLHAIILNVMKSNKYLVLTCSMLFSWTSLEAKLQVLRPRHLNISSSYRSG